MQVLKDDIRERIVSTATRLFYAHGFAQTTMRQIADDAEMSVSNLYKYFKNKEDLFGEIVKAYHVAYLAGFKRFVSHEDKDGFDEDGNSALTHALFDSIKSDPMKFVLLMDKSRGTRYENFKDEVVGILSEHILRDISAANKQEYMVRLLVRNFFGGIAEVAKNYINDRWALRNLGLLVRYHMNGMKALYEP